MTAFAAGSDCANHLTEVIVSYLREKGHPVRLYGALAGHTADYVDAAIAVGESVAAGTCDQGLLFCTTGTGVTIIANKIPEVRAACCPDGHTARIARLANNANVLVIGMRLTGEIAAKEIVDTWLTTAPSEEPRRVAFHRKTAELDRRYRQAT
jgi:ribose 5-phosphate isomerase B